MADRRNDVLVSHTLACDQVIIERINQIENLVSMMNASVAHSGNLDDILDFCCSSRTAILNSSPFTDDGRSVRVTINRGFADLGRLMCDTAEGLRQLQKRFS
jgi:hypothetical protein